MSPSGRNIDFLTGEALVGESLSSRLGRSRLSVEEGLRYAMEAGRILATAHSRGLVHGGLSPDCILLTRAGARVLRLPDAGAQPPQYHSPEQVRGKSPDCRSDNFAFGAILYEMLTGQPAFAGTGEELDRAILESTSPWAGPEFLVPADLAETIASLMTKDPARRRQRIQHAVIELKVTGIESSRPTPSGKPRRRPQAPPATRPAMGLWSRRFAAVAITLLALAGTAVAAVLLLRKGPSPPVFKFTVAAPEQTEYIGGPALSPDGRQVAFSAIGAEGARMLWLRSLDNAHSAPIKGTEGAAHPFWSPDGRSIAFFANGSLKRIGVLNGTPFTICAAEEQGGGGTWNRDGVIVFAPGLSTGVYRVSAGGGTAQPLLRTDSRKRERSFLWPEFMPDGEHFLFFDLTDKPETTGVYVGSVGGTERKMLLRSTTNAAYAGGRLLFIKGSRLVAQEFDPARLVLEGEPATVTNDIGVFTSLSLMPLSASNNGVVAYQVAGKQTRRLVWSDRNGVQLGAAAEPGEYGAPRLSPDGTRVAVEKLGSGNRPETWVLSEGQTAQIAGFASGTQVSPVWSPDGAAVVCGDDRDGVSNLYSIGLKPIGIPSPAVFESPYAKYPTDWSRNGKYVLFTSLGQGTGPHVWALSVAAHQARAIVTTAGHDRNAAFSPDGRWIAYQSNESGTDEIYVQPFDGLWGGAEGRRRISSGGGGLPRWSRDGAELYFVTAGGALMSVTVRGPGNEREFAQPQELFHTRQIAGTWNSFDVSPDAQRFILNLPLEDSTSSPITILANWLDTLKH